MTGDMRWVKVFVAAVVLVAGALVIAMMSTPTAPCGPGRATIGPDCR